MVLAPLSIIVWQRQPVPLKVIIEESLSNDH